MASRGFQIVAAIKGPGSIEDGINFLKSYDIVVHPRCHHLLDELIHYCWSVDGQTGEILPKLADAHNHVIDALRYALEGARKTSSDRFSFASAGPREALNAYEQVPGVEATRSHGWGASGSWAAHEPW
jgi:phage terminase large subunit